MVSRTAVHEIPATRMHSAFFRSIYRMRIFIQFPFSTYPSNSPHSSPNTSFNCPVMLFWGGGFDVFAMICRRNRRLYACAMNSRSTGKNSEPKREGNFLSVGVYVRVHVWFARCCISGKREQTMIRWYQLENDRACTFCTHIHSYFMHTHIQAVLDACARSLAHSYRCVAHSISGSGKSGAAIIEWE